MTDLKKIDWKPAVAVGKAIGASVLVILGFLTINAATLLAFSAGGNKVNAIVVTLVSNALTCLAIAGATILTWTWKKRTPFQIDDPRPLKNPRPRHLLILVATLWFVWAVGQTTAVWLIKQGHGASFEKYQQAISTAPVPLILLALLVAAPVTEELLMRGTIYPRMRKAMGYMPAAVLSALLFAAMHGTTVHLAYTVSLGILLAIAYELTRMLWVPVLMHLLFNLGALVPAAVLEPLATQGMVLAGNVVLIVVLANLHDVVVAQDPKGTEPDLPAQT